MHQAKAVAINWAEQGYMPDPVMRRGVRLLLKRRLASLPLGDIETLGRHEQAFVDGMRAAPVALVPERANDQHYELPPAFFEHVLGRHRKYSCGYWPKGVADLDASEQAALAVTVERADLTDGQDILELGCGWGALTLWMAEQFPNSRITAVSNSRAQGDVIRELSRQRGLLNLTVLTADMNDFDTGKRFDRVVSLEMFEHMRNWAELCRRVSSWLRPGGKFFKHIFVHRGAPYDFASDDPQDWMGQHFFAGGIMPSFDLPLHFQDDLRLLKRWAWSGEHYEKTANAWLAEFDAQIDVIRDLFEVVYGDHAETWIVRWRLFFMSCAELFGYRAGQEWFVGHYLFEHR